MKESEGKAMKKDIEWLKKEISKEMSKLEHNRNKKDGDLKYQTLRSVAQKIYQLDEQEVLSQEWIDDNKEMYLINDTSENAVPDYKLQNLLVPKQEITFDQVHDKLREESILSEKSFDYYWNCINDNVEIDEPGNLLVPKQEELETKIHELIESYKQEEDAYSNPENGWISGFIEDLENLVEEEQKYYVDLDTAAYVAKWNGDNQVDIYTDDISGSDEFEFHLTEQEIKNFDERFWAFAEPIDKVV